MQFTYLHIATFLPALLWYLPLTCSVKQSSKPHIIFIVADDLGWDDVSFHGSNQIPTPNIDKLANDGVILNNYYVSPICTPTRSAIMTGRHPIHTGMQNGVILAAQPYGLGLNETLMPQYLKELGYATHGVGKWHLGFFKFAYTPSKRGFDSFYGYWSGKEDYWDHSSAAPGQGWGLDFHNNTENDFTEWGMYSTELFTSLAVDIIQSHDPSKPLYLYLPHQAVHSANSIQPLQAPQKLINKFKNIEDERRRIYAAMVTALDDSVGKVRDALMDKGLYNNSVIVFTTDNGGPATGFDKNMASNFPLRGVKATLWEGGVRGAAFVHSPLLASKGRVSMDLLHVTDWLPTLYSLAGGDASKLRNVDGYDVWDTLSSGKSSPRQELLHNVHTSGGEAAMRYGQWKILVNAGKAWNGWYPPPGYEESNFSNKTLKNAVVMCGQPPSNPPECTKSAGPCLFDIEKDPCEYVNLASQHGDIVQKLLAKLEGYRNSSVPSRNKPIDPRANPKYHGGAWVAWGDLP
ncbi:arylsulfatase B-like [Oculina patagonica]